MALVNITFQFNLRNEVILISDTVVLIVKINMKTFKNKSTFRIVEKEYTNCLQNVQISSLQKLYGCVWDERA